MTNDVTALSIPGELYNGPTMIEKLGRCVPIVGWIIANELEKKRVRPLADSISAQLESRASKGLKMPVGGACATPVGRFVADSIRRHFEWPNDLYLDDDPMTLLFILDDGVGIEVFRDIEKFLRLPTGTISADSIKNLQHITFGNAVSELAKLSKSPVASVD